MRVRKPRDAEEKAIAQEQERKTYALRKMGSDKALVQADSRRKAAAELAARELARRHMLPFILRFERDYLPGWVHRDICRRLEKFERDVREKKSPRLMLQMPPRHGKSIIASINFPAWYLGRNPSHEFIGCSYASSLAYDFSRKIRERIRDPEYHLLFPGVSLNKDSQATEYWTLNTKGCYSAAGVNGPITGKGAHVLAIDDPVKNAEDADSAVTREMHKNWYQSTAYTRLAPGGGVLIIQTRWNDDDLSGWLETLMHRGEGDEFEIVRYPAEALEDERHRAQGEALHPERYDSVALAKIRRAVGPRVWSALYQQQPVADEGSYFTRDMLRYYKELPNERLTHYAVWDLAISKKETADYTVGVVFAVDSQENIYVVDMARGRYDGFEIVERMIDMHVRYGTEINAIEKGQIEMAIRPQLDKRIAERRAQRFYAKPMPAGGRDKQSRARPIQARMQQGKVFLPSDAPWLGDMTHELLRFPNGVHDDIVDCFGWIGQLLGEVRTDKARAAPKPKSWRDKLGKYLKSGADRDFMAA